MLPFLFFVNLPDLGSKANTKKMKILYAIQGTGNGHVSRAREVIPHLQRHGQVDLVLSGTQAEVGLEQEIKYRFNGMGFVFGKNGGISLLESWKRFDTRQFIKDVLALPVESYDLVISDYEPVTAWACVYRRKKCLAMSHQASFKSEFTPRLPGFHWGAYILNNYAPATHRVGFHFKPYDSFIQTPIIRKEIRDLRPENLGHYTVYLPAYSDAFILNLVAPHKTTRWEVFSKHALEPYEKAHVKVIPIHNEAFLKSLAGCEGFLTGGGFEGPAEALFLRKKLLSVPMKNQYEQQCNALALEQMGIEVVWQEAQFKDKLKRWVESEHRIEVNYPDTSSELIAKLIQTYGS